MNDEDNPTLIRKPKLHSSSYEGAKAPLFLIHDGSGLIFNYFFLGDLGRHVYGISNPKFLSGEEWKGGLDEMARRYVGYVRKVLRSGENEIILGGWSMGGLLSLQMAHILNNEEVSRPPKVKSILMVDCINPQIRPSPGNTIMRYNPEWPPDTSSRMKDLVEKSFSQTFGMTNEWQIPWTDSSPPSIIELKALQHVPAKLFGEEEKTSLNERQEKREQDTEAQQGGRDRGEFDREHKRIVRVDIPREYEKLGWENFPKISDAITEVIQFPEHHHYNIFEEKNITKLTQRMNEALEKLDALTG